MPERSKYNSFYNKSLVAEEGFEPPTSRIWVVRSNQLSYSAFNKIYTLNDSPHPHVLFSFGFLNTNLDANLSDE